MRFSLLVVITITLVACASSNRDTDTTVARVADLAAARGRLESELATSKQRADTERAARIDAEARLAVRTYELALEKHNAVIASTLCNVNSGAIGADAAKARLNASAGTLEPFFQGCARTEPVNGCVERKARAEAERSP